jgi:hypothetical protein
MSEYFRPAISNGNPHEQALIRRWWHENHAARGRIVWEYCLEGLYADAIWFPEIAGHGIEETGQQSSLRFPLRGSRVVLCEAKIKLTPELIGQALVYAWYAEQAGASVEETIVFAQLDPYSRQKAAEALGLTVVIYPLDLTARVPR